MNRFALEDEGQQLHHILIGQDGRLFQKGLQHSGTGAKPMGSLASGQPFQLVLQSLLLVLSVCVLRCIKELLKTAQEITELYNNGKKLGLTQEELAFYDALTKPENIKDFYQNNELIDLTRELTEMLRKNRTIDWQKKETARASMRKMVKHLLKKYKYPPEDYDTAISTVISQCEMWTDNMTA